MNFPFRQHQLGKNVFLREFKEHVENEELIWHQDLEDREVYVVESNGWALQMDNELPKALIEGKKYFIPKMTFHRVLKGHGDLKIILKKL